MKKLIIAALCIGIALYAADRLGFTEALKDVALMREFFKGLGVGGYLAFVAVSVLVSVFLLPGQFLAVIAGLTYGGLQGGLLTAVGATIGSYISFVIGKRLARDYIVNKFGGNPVFQKIERGVKENGMSFLILTRLVPVFPFAIQSYAYALTPMGAGMFTLISFVTMLPASFIYACMASEIVMDGFSLKILTEFAVAGVILFIISFIPKRIAKKRNIKFE